MPRYVQLQQVEGSDLKNIVSRLVALGASGQFVYADVSGVRLLSDKVSLDSAYYEVFGVSYAEYADSHYQTSTPTSPAKRRLSELLDASARIISAENKSEWVTRLQKMIKTPNCIDIFENALRIIGLLNTGSLAEAVAVFFDCKESLRGAISDLVEEFSEYGGNFLARIRSEANIRHDAQIMRTTHFE